MTKRIEAFVREETLSQIKRELTKIGIIGMSVSHVRGRGRGSGIQLQWRTGVYTVDLLPRVLITIFLSDENVDATVDAIKSAAYTGEKGDGVIVISPVDTVIRISTGEEGREAITYQGDIDSRK